MRILLICVYYHPSTTSCASMMRDLALEYMRRGHQVIVLTPDDSVADTVRVTEEDGVTVLRIRSGAMKNENKMLRAWRESCLSTKIWRNARQFFQANPCQLIVYYSPTIFFGGIVRRLKSMWNCHAYLILRDIFPKWTVDIGLIAKGGIFHRYLRRKELEQYDVADIIGVETPASLDYFEKELAHKHYRTEVLSNWINPGSRPHGCHNLRAKLGLEGKVVFVYGGNVGVAQDIDNILRLARSVQNQTNIFFLLIGDGSEVPRIESEIENQHLRNIRILPPLPQEEYLQYLSECDVGLLTLDRRLQSHNVPGKLLGYMICGLPVLASLNPGNGLIRILQDADSGIACVNGDDEKLRAAALLLAVNAELRQKMGRNALALGEAKLSVQTAAGQILSHFPISSGNHTEIEAVL